MAAVGEVRRGTPTPPCRDCADRRVGCHGTDESGAWRCEAYGAYQAEMDKLRKEKREAKDAADVMRWYVRARSARLVQRKNLEARR